MKELKLNFMKFMWLYFGLSLIVIIPGLISLILFGLKPSIDFTGGTLVEVTATQSGTLSEEVIRQSLPGEVDVASIQSTGDNAYLIRSQSLSPIQNTIFQDKLASVTGTLIQEDRFETVGPTLGRELLQKTFAAIAIAAFIILIYVATRFSEVRYGICAIIAMFHDTFILLGTFSILGHFYGVEVDTLFVTAVLTTLSFSVHDTIVVYDRIRESLKNHPQFDFVTLVNKAVAETLGRSLNNSLTIIFMLLTLWLMGGESTKWFVFALLIGTIAGTYSSTFTAAPLLVLWERIQTKKK